MAFGILFRHCSPTERYTRLIQDDPLSIPVVQGFRTSTDADTVGQTIAVFVETRLYAVVYMRDD